MNPDLPPQPSLQGMRDILVPPPVPFWPATPAWAAIGALLLAILLWLGWRALRRWRADAYRRAALGALDGAGPVGLAALVKRAALAAHPRAAVAGLAGADWAAWLRRSAPRARLTAEEARALADLPFLDDQAARAAAPGARAAARRWIARHDRAA